MARIVTGAFTTFNLSTHLDPMTADLYDLREIIGTPGYTPVSPSADYYFGFTPFSTLRYNFFVPASSDSAQMRIRSGTTDVVTFNSTGNALFNAATFGYGVGIGGAVTQATSKATAVTLNKACGQVTMNSASLASGASVSFTLNNSLVTGLDLIVANASGGAADKTVYRIEPSLQSAAISIKVTNTSGGALAEALVINFAVIKGSIS